MQLPLKLRLTLVFTVGMAVLVIALGGFIYSRVAADLLDSVDAGLRSRAQIIVHSVGQTASPTEVLAEGSLIDSDEAFAQVLGPRGEIVQSTSAVFGAPLLTRNEIQSMAGPFFVSRQIEEIGAYDKLDDPFRLLAIPMGDAAQQVVIVGSTLSDVNESLERLLQVMATLGPLAIIVTAGAGWLLAGAALRQVEQMRQEAAAVSASDPTRRLAVPRTGDELARLATTLNSMLDRLQTAIERERRFVDNASHELRTPLATLKAEIELALARRRKARDLEASLRSAQQDVNRLQRLTEDLLVLARSRGGRIPVRRAQIRLNEVVARGLQALEDQIREAGARVEVEAADDVVELDPERVHQALRNVLENAIRHMPQDGLIRVDAARNGHFVQLSVTDSGPGFPPELLATVFDPFTRDAYEDWGPSGTGLGLAIVRTVAEAHGGRVFAENVPSGAKVTIELRSN